MSVVAQALPVRLEPGGIEDGIRSPSIGEIAQFVGDG